MKSLVADVVKQLAIVGNQLPMGRTGSGLLSYGSFGPWYAPQWRAGDTFDYAASVQYGRSNSIVWACLNAMANAFPEAPPIAYRADSDDGEKPEPQHPAALLIRRPNPHMSWPLMASYLMVSLHLDGSAYFWKQRAGNKKPMALWPIPPWQIVPVWPEEATTENYVIGYEYTPPGQGEPIFLDASEVVHLRRMVDPENHRLGLNALFPVFRQIFTDEEAAAFTAAMLKNFGVPGVVLSPKPAADQAGVRVTAADARRWKEAFKTNFSGDNRGEPMVMALPMDVSVASFSPQQMSFEALHRIPETRICAVLNVPPSVANLLAGLEHNTYSNNREQREAFYQQTMTPLWRLVAEELTRTLMVDFERDPAKVRLDFNTNEVKSLQENENEKMTRIRELTGGPILTLNEARDAAGYPALPDGDALYIPSTVVLTQITDLIPPEPEPGALLPDGTPDPNAPPLPEDQAAADEEDDTDGLVATVEAITQAGWDGEPVYKSLQGDPVGPEVLLKASYSSEVSRLRKSLEDEATRELRAFLTAQMKRTATRAARSQKAFVDAALIGPTEIRALRRVLEPLYLKTLQSMTGITSRTLRRTVQLEREAEKAFIRDAGWRIRRINERTRRAVRRVMALSREKGWDGARTAQELSKLAAFNEARALTIARTEIGEMTNQAAQTVFERSRTVTHVEFFDRESDELCKGWNRKVLPLAAARNVPMLFHPNCSQQRFPVVKEEGDGER
jgi:HK97 family phage portal protein